MEIEFCIFNQIKVIFLGLIPILLVSLFKNGNLDTSQRECLMKTKINTDAERRLPCENRGRDNSDINMTKKHLASLRVRGFSSSTSGKDLPASAGDLRDVGYIPGLGRFPR